jgi:ferredoxin-NADP reductase
MRSIILQALHDRKPHRLLLFYSNRRPEDAAFLQEFQDAQKTHPNFTLIPTMTGMEASQRTWDGQTTAIDIGMLKERLPGLGSAIYFIAGPGPMVLAMREMLKTAGVPEQRINIELFSGYA